MKDEYEFRIECPEIDIENISLCEKKVHGDMFNLYIKAGMEVNIDQLKEIAKFKTEGLHDEQDWILTLKKVKK